MAHHISSRQVGRISQESFLAREVDFLEQVALFPLPVLQIVDFPLFGSTEVELLPLVVEPSPVLSGT